MRFVVKKEIFEELPSACFGVVMAVLQISIASVYLLRRMNSRCE